MINFYILLSLCFSLVFTSEIQTTENIINYPEIKGMMNISGREAFIDMWEYYKYIAEMSGSNLKQIYLNEAAATSILIDKEH